MVAKISHGTSLYGALAYNYGKVAAGTAEILSGNRMISDRLGLPGTDMRLALLSFENYLLANRNTEKPVLHIALSPAPEDRLTDVQLEELAARYMEKMGYGDQPYIVYRHSDTHNTHIHIVSVCVDGEGRKISDAYEHRRSMAACRELETDFGLRNGADTEKRDLKAEPGKVDVSAGDIRHQIGSTLKAVLEGYRFQSFGEYSALLSAFNIEAGLVKGEYKGVPYTGIVYSATDGRARVVSPPFKRYNPPGRRRMYFTKGLNIENGEFNLPGIIYVVERGGLNVFAFKGERPSMDDRLCKAPYFNVNATSGSVCLGNASLQIPEAPTFDRWLEYWEKRFWMSEFSHLGGGGNPTRSNLVLVTEKARNNPFDENELLLSEKRLKDLLA